MTALWPQAVLELLYPRRCFVCGRVLGSLLACPECAAALHSLRRSVPRIQQEKHELMAVDWAAGVYRYEGAAARAVRTCKFAGRPWYAREFGRQIAEVVFSCQTKTRLGVPVLCPTLTLSLAFDCIVPVPFSDGERGYSAALLMARTLSQALGLPCEPAALRKIRKTPPQSSLDRQARLLNLIGAFQGDPRRVEGKRILLVDDVITTGATVSHCALALLKAGAQEVCAVSFAVTEADTKRPASDPSTEKGVENGTE